MKNLISLFLILLPFLIFCQSSRKTKSVKAKTGLIEMVYVAGGTFQMGSNNGEKNESPVHTVTLSSYYIGKYEVTQAQWKEIMGINPSTFKGDNLPVEWVTLGEIQEFINKLNIKTGNIYRLPTEAEWEFAAKGGIKSRGYIYSGSNILENVAWFGNKDGSTHPVGTKKPNELGIYDMTGNVDEWTNDLCTEYGNIAQTNPTGSKTGFENETRGGNYITSEKYSRLTYRFCIDGSKSHSSQMGFRLASSKL